MDPEQVTDLTNNTDIMTILSTYFPYIIGLIIAIIGGKIGLKYIADKKEKEKERINQQNNLLRAHVRVLKKEDELQGKVIEDIKENDQKELELKETINNTIDKANEEIESTKNNTIKETDSTLDDVFKNLKLF